MNNPYLEACRKIPPDGLFPGILRSFYKRTEESFPMMNIGHTSCTDNRGVLTNLYAWAIPNEAAIKAIAAHSPLIEIGAGTGYWAKLLGR